MRNIKYRCWDKNNKRIEYLDFLNLSKAKFCGNWEIKPPEDLFDVATTKGKLFDFMDVELMEFTGLEDKNGVEIYEFDIVEFEHYFYSFDSLKMKSKTLFGPIVFSPPFFRIGSYSFDLFGDKLKVIGNVFENPELIEEYKNLRKKEF